MVFKSKTMKKGGKVKKTQKRIRGGNVFSGIMSYLPGGKKEEHPSHTTVPVPPAQPTQPMQQMQPVPPQQGGKKKYSKGRKGRKGGNLFQKDIPPPMKHGGPTFINCENPIEVQKHPMYCASVHAAHKAAHGASHLAHKAAHGASHLAHNVAQGARKTASAVGSMAPSMFGGSKRKSKKQRKTYKKKYSKAKKSRKMRH